MAGPPDGVKRIRLDYEMVLRDGRKLPGPRSGYPEAAMAGAMGVRPGGPSAYSGVVSEKPYLGDGVSVLDEKIC